MKQPDMRRLLGAVAYWAVVCVAASAAVVLAPLPFNGLTAYYAQITGTVAAAWWTCLLLDTVAARTTGARR